MAPSATDKAGLRQRDARREAASGTAAGAKDAAAGHGAKKAQAKKEQASREAKKEQAAAERCWGLTLGGVSTNLFTLGMVVYACVVGRNIYGIFQPTFPDTNAHGVAVNTPPSKPRAGCVRCARACV